MSKAGEQHRRAVYAGELGAQTSVPVAEILLLLATAI